MKKVKGAVVGLGRHGMRHIKAINNTGLIDLLALCDVKDDFFNNAKKYILMLDFIMIITIC